MVLNASNLIAIAAFLACVIRYVILQQWTDYAILMVFAFFGLMSVIAPETMADFSGNYGWTRRQWRVLPGGTTRVIGVLALAGATVFLFLA